LTKIGINLLGADRKEALSRKGSLPIDKGWIACVGMILGALIIVFLANTTVGNWVADAKETKTENEAKLKSLAKDLKEIASLEKKEKNMIMEEKILIHVTGDTYRWSYLLEEVRTLMPLSTKINNLKISSSGTFTLVGSAPDHRTVALYLSSLQSSKMLTSVQLKASTKTESLTSFTITCKVKAE